MLGYERKLAATYAKKNGKNHLSSQNHNYGFTRSSSKDRHLGFTGQQNPAIWRGLHVLLSGNYNLSVFRFLMIHFSSIDTKKLTVAPIAARTVVLITSAELIFTTIISRVPPTVPCLVYDDLSIIAFHF